MLAISALVSAPNNVIAPANSQIPSSNSGEPIWAAITPGFRKIPEPMTPPTTIMMVVKRLSVGTRPDVAGGISFDLRGGCILLKPQASILKLQGSFNVQRTT